MKKKLKDYLHFYLSPHTCSGKDGDCVNSNICQMNDCCTWPAGVRMYIFPDESITNGFLDNYRKENPNGIYDPILTFKNYEQFLKAGYKPILRSIDDITNEEFMQLRELENSLPNRFEAATLVLQKLIKEKYDMFGLMKENLAIDQKHFIKK